MVLVKVTEASELQAALIGILGRMVSAKELREALGVATTTYPARAGEGLLITADNILRASRSLGVNEILLLVECGLLEPASVDDYVAHRKQRPASPVKKRKPLSDVPDL